MPESVKLKNNKFWNTNGIYHGIGSNRELLSSLLAKLKEKNIMTLSLSGNSSFTISNNVPTKITLNSSISVGSKLSVQSGGIKIGSGVSKILVSHSVRYAWDFGDVGIVSWVTKNGSAIPNSYGSNTNGLARFRCTNQPPILVSVSENDLLELYFCPDGGNITSKSIGYNGTFITVEVVE